MINHIYSTLLHTPFTLGSARNTRFSTPLVYPSWWLVHTEVIMWATQAYNCLIKVYVREPFLCYLSQRKVPKIRLYFKTSCWTIMEGNNNKYACTLPYILVFVHAWPASKPDLHSHYMPIRDLNLRWPCNVCRAEPVLVRLLALAVHTSIITEP